PPWRANCVSFAVLSTLISQLSTFLDDTVTYFSIPSKAPASASGRLTCGQCPPGSSIGSTPSNSRAALRCQPGVIVRSLEHAIYADGTAGQARSGHGSSIARLA